MAAVVDKVIKRNGEIVPFNRDKITDAIYKAAYAVGGHDRSLSEQLADDVSVYLQSDFDPEQPPSVEEVNDIVEKVLIERGHARTAKAFILYRAERAQSRGRQSRRAPTTNSAFIPYHVLYHVLMWNIANDCETITKVNEKIEDGSYPELVRACNATYEADIEAAARQIIDRKGEIRLAVIAGPSSSGKTTTTAKMAQYLRAEGLELVALNLDNYYYDLHVHPKDEYGDYDFEGPQALDLPLINEHLGALLEGKEVIIPRFDFPSGKRLPDGDPLRIGPSQIIMIDSLHGLYDPMSESVSPDAKFKLYIETLSQMFDSEHKLIRWTDVRMLRRMVRDNVHRNYNPVRTVGHWHYVRRSELKYIVPYINNVDFILNSALPYELPALKKHVYEFLPGIIEAYADDPHKADAYLRATRVKDLLDGVTTLEDEECIPKESLVREFIGGGIYGQ